MTVDEVLGAMDRGELPRPVSVTPPPIEPEAPRPPRRVAPQIDVEPQPWERPSWATAAAPVTRAGADIHMRSASAMAVCGADEVPLASVADPTQVTCRACRLMISAPHISPCTTERWLRDAPAPAAEPVVAAAPPQRSRTGTIVAGGLAAAAIVGAVVVAVVALSGHGGSTSGTAANTTLPGDIQTIGGEPSAEPTPFSTALPTEAPTAAPTGAPTSAPSPTPVPAVSQNVTVIDTNGQSQEQAQAQAQATASAQANADPPADPPAATSITFDNNASRVIDVFWVNAAGTEVKYSSLAPGASGFQQTNVGQTWVIRWDPCCVGAGGSDSVLDQITATAAPQTVHFTG